MTETASLASLRWRDGAKADQKREMRELTLELAAKALFGIEMGDVVRRVGESFAVAKIALATLCRRWPGESLLPVNPQDEGRNAMILEWRHQRAD